MLQENFMNSVQRMLQATIKQQRALSKNIANQNTPGYHREEVDFAKVLRGLKTGQSVKLEATEPTHLTGAVTKESGIQAEQTNEPIEQGKINNVDLDYEMSNMAKTQIYYEMLARVMRQRFRDLRMTITGKTT